MHPHAQSRPIHNKNYFKRKSAQCQALVGGAPNTSVYSSTCSPTSEFERSYPTSSSRWPLIGALSFSTGDLTLPPSRASRPPAKKKKHSFNPRSTLSPKHCTTQRTAIETYCHHPSHFLQVSRIQPHIVGLFVPVTNVPYPCQPR